MIKINEEGIIIEYPIGFLKGVLSNSYYGMMILKVDGINITNIFDLDWISIKQKERLRKIVNKYQSKLPMALTSRFI